MKAIAIVDIDDELLKHYKDFAIEGELIATSKEDALWRDCLNLVGETELKLLPKKKQIGEKYSSDKTYELICLGYNACIDEILQEEE